MTDAYERGIHCSLKYDLRSSSCKFQGLMKFCMTDQNNSKIIQSGLWDWKGYTAATSCFCLLPIFRLVNV